MTSKLNVKIIERLERIEVIRFGDQYVQLNPELQIDIPLIIQTNWQNSLRKNAYEEDREINEENITTPNLLTSTLVLLQELLSSFRNRQMTWKTKIGAQDVRFVESKITDATLHAYYNRNLIHLLLLANAALFSRNFHWLYSIIQIMKFTDTFVFLRNKTLHLFW